LLHLDDGIWGQVAVVIAAFSYALAGVYGRRFARQGVKPITLATGQVTFSSLVMIPVALVFEDAMSLAFPSPQVWAALVVLGVLSTVVAYLLYFRILESAGATNALLVTLLIPVSAITFGAAFLGESLAPNHFIGMALIGLGLLMIDGRLIKLRKNA
jgi:drug/metabolite transporter (DMT)-like permease